MSALATLAPSTGSVRIRSAFGQWGSHRAIALTRAGLVLATGSMRRIKQLAAHLAKEDLL